VPCCKYHRKTKIYDEWEEEEKRIDIEESVGHGKKEMSLIHRHGEWGRWRRGGRGAVELISL
jgi:hypothetical protein